MKKIIIIIAFATINHLFSKTWVDVLKEKEVLLKDCSIINEQYNTFINSAFIISNPIVKSIQISENNEPLVDVRTIANSRISMLPDSPENKSFVAPHFNSGLPSASKVRKEIYKKMEGMITYLDELAPSFGYKSGSISIKLFEGLRDLKTQEILFQNKFNEIKSHGLLKTDEEITLETSKWVSPVKNSVPPHSTGAAIDIRLWNEITNDFVDLGKFGAIWGTNNEAPTFSENITDDQKLNRLYLLIAATRAGLINYSFEYWHFSHGDRYAMYWLDKDINKRKAFYGPID